jgi:phosphatidylglycerophosphatase A
LSFPLESDINDTKEHRPGFGGSSGANKIALGVATCLGVGKCPIAPGSVASLLTIPLYLLLSSVQWWLMVGVTGALLTLGIWASGRAEFLMKKRDPSFVVIDEVVGYLVAMQLLPPSFWKVVVGFSLFRCLDIIKPPPIRWLDRSIQGGVGIMADDLVAGIITNLALRMFPW